MLSLAAEDRYNIHWLHQSRTVSPQAPLPHHRRQCLCYLLHRHRHRQTRLPIIRVLPASVDAHRCPITSGVQVYVITRTRAFRIFSCEPGRCAAWMGSVGSRCVIFPCLSPPPQPPTPPPPPPSPKPPPSPSPPHDVLSDMEDFEATATAHTAIGSKDGIGMSWQQGSSGGLNAATSATSLLPPLGAVPDRRHSREELRMACLLRGCSSWQPSWGAASSRARCDGGSLASLLLLAGGFLYVADRPGTRRLPDSDERTQTRWTRTTWRMAQSVWQVCRIMRLPRQAKIQSARTHQAKQAET